MSSIMKGIINEAEAFDYDRLKAMPAKERIAYLRDKPELRNLYNAEFQKRIDAELNNYSWMTPEEKAHYEKLAAADDTSQGMQSKSFSAEKYLKQLFQKKMDAKKAASMLKVHWAPLEDLQKYLTGQISTKTELSAYLAKSPEDLGKLRWGSGTIGIVVDGHITIGGRGDLGSDQYKTVNGVRGQQKYASRPGQIDPTFDTLDLGKHHEVLVDNWKIREIVLPPDIPENVDAIIKKAGIPVRRLANQEQPINEEELDENLRKWFKEKWVRFGPDGKIRGACARGSDKEGKPKCLPQSKAHSIGKKGRKYAAAKKRREDPNPERRGKAKNVATKKKSNEEIQVNEKWSQKYKDSINCSNPKGFSQKAHCAGKKKNEDMNENIPFNECPNCRGPIVHESMMNEKKDACYHKVKSRYKVWPSAYASGALVQCRKKGASNWGTGGKKKNESSIMKGLVDEGVIIGHDANDPDVAVLGGAGSYKLSNLKKKAQMEANELAKDVSEGKFKNSAYNVKQLANTLNTIAAAEEEMEKSYFGENAWNQLGQRKPNTNLPAPEKGSRINHGKRFEEGDIVLPLSGPLKGQPHKVIHSQRTSIRIVPLGRNTYPGDTIAPRTKHEWVVPADINEDYTGMFAAEKTAATNPYGGQKDRQFRGAISEEMDEARQMSPALRAAQKNLAGLASGEVQRQEKQRKAAEKAQRQASKDLDRMLNRKPAKKTKQDLQTLWAKIESVIANSFPDGEPYDQLWPYMQKHGFTQDDVERASKMNGYDDLWDYWNTLTQDIENDAYADWQISGGKNVRTRGTFVETPTDNPTGASGEGGWRKYKPKSAGITESYPANVKQYARDLAREMREEGYDWEPVDLSDTEEAIDDAREQLSMFASSNMCDFFGDYDEGEQLQLIKMFNKKFGGVKEDTAYAGGGGQGGNAGESYRKFKPKSAGTFKEDEQLDEKCWKGYKKQGTKKMFGKTYPNCVKNTNEDLSRSDVDDIERFADKLYKKLGIDVTFTKHFMDRVNDERNGKPISGAELVRLFKKEYDRWGKQVAQMGPDEEGTFKDLLTDINLPFVLRWDRDEEELDLIAKTVMRKKNFKTHNQEFPVESHQELDEKCWDSHKQVGMKKKGGKMVPNCVPKESAIMKGIKR